jgi:hypothetical protein
MLKKRKESDSMQKNLMDDLLNTKKEKHPILCRKI